MMVKVIGHRDEIVYKATCVGCGSILEFTRTDVKQGSTEESCPRSYQYINCPVCEENYEDHPDGHKLGRVKITEKIL